MQDHHLIRIGQWLHDVPRSLTANEEYDVRAHLVLFVDHAEADAGILSVQVMEQFIQRFPDSVHPISMIGIGEEGLGDGDPHLSICATSTEYISGRCAASVCQCSPSFALPQISPEVVPK